MLNKLLNTSIRGWSHVRDQMSCGDQERSLCNQYAISHIARSCNLMHTRAITGQSARWFTSQTRTFWRRETVIGRIDIPHGQVQSDSPSRIWLILPAADHNPSWLCAFNFICFHILQLTTQWSLMAPDRHSSSDHVGATVL